MVDTHARKHHFRAVALRTLVVDRGIKARNGDVQALASSHLFRRNSEMIGDLNAVRLVRKRRIQLTNPLPKPSECAADAPVFGIVWSFRMKLLMLWMIEFGCSLRMVFQAMRRTRRVL